MVFTDKVVAEPSWAKTKELSDDEKTAARMNEAETIRYQQQFAALSEKDQQTLLDLGKKMREEAAKHGQPRKASLAKYTSFLQERGIEMPQKVTPESVAATRKAKGQTHDEL